MAASGTCPPACARAAAEAGRSRAEGCCFLLPLLLFFFFIFFSSLCSEPFYMLLDPVFLSSANSSVYFHTPCVPWSLCFRTHHFSNILVSRSDMSQKTTRRKEILLNTVCADSISLHPCLDVIFIILSLVSFKTWQRFETTCRSLCWLCGTVVLGNT